MSMKYHDPISPHANFCYNRTMWAIKLIFLIWNFEGGGGGEVNRKFEWLFGW